MDFYTLSNLKSSKIDLKNDSLTIVLAAGHGKRIRSSVPKVAHLVWGKPSVVRVLEAARRGFKTDNEVVVVGRKADEVIHLLESRKHRLFAYQKEQLGTGDAVRVGMGEISPHYSGNIFVLPGDVGLIDQSSLTFLKRNFIKSKASMMLLTGMYRGDPESNYFGRVVRVPEFDLHGNLVPEEDYNHILAIVQHRDILNLKPQQSWVFSYRGKKYSFLKQTLLNIKEFDSAIFAFKFQDLKKYLAKLSDKENIQHEFYLTDLVEIFNRVGLKVDSVSVPNDQALLGFNDKTVWRMIEQVFRKKYYDRLKNIIDIEDENRFFIDEKVVQQLEQMDRKSTAPLDIFIASGVYIGPQVKLARGISIGADTKLLGQIHLHEGVKLGHQIRMETMGQQKIVVGKESQIMGSNVIKGKVEIGKNVFISANANFTGSDDFPTKIGDKASIFGSCYLFGTIVSGQSVVESSVLIKKKINCGITSDGKVQPVRFYLPPPEGTGFVKDF